MAEEFSPETRAQIRELASEIVGRKALDGPVGVELQGHIEDNMLSYLQGERPVSEQDAFTLAREHFGDRGAVAKTLAELHDTAPQLPAKRLFVFLLIPACMSFVWFIPGMLLLAGWPFGATYAFPILFPLFLVAYFGVLRHWRAQSEKGKRLWFESWPLAALASFYFILILARIVAGMALAVLRDHGVDPGQYTQTPAWVVYYGTGAIWASFVLTPVLLLWWCEAVPGSVRATFRLLAAYLLITGFVSLLTNLFLVRGTEVAHLSTQYQALYTSGNLIVYWNSAVLNSYRFVLLAQELFAATLGYGLYYWWCAWRGSNRPALAHD